MNASGMVTYVGVAHPWMCDTMGHLNVRHYAAMFDDASFQLLGHIGGREFDGARLGWADARLELDYVHEVRAGALVTVRSHVEKVGTSSLACSHVMAGSLDGTVYARARIVTVHFDLAGRVKLAIEGALRGRAEALLVPARGA